jgi:hypothetical protein
MTFAVIDKESELGQGEFHADITPAAAGDADRFQKMVRDPSSPSTGWRYGAQNKLDEKPPSTGMAAPVT